MTRNIVVLQDIYATQPSRRREEAVQGKEAIERYNVALCQAFRAQRLRKRWTQVQAGIRLGIDASNLSHIEIGTRPPSRRFLAAACDAFGVPLEVILVHALMLYHDPEATTPPTREQAALIIKLAASQGKEVA